MSHYTFVLNWKMYFSFDQAKQWLEDNKNALEELAHDQSFILCPSHESLWLTTAALEGAAIEIGAQQCSAHELGAYTGQVSAASLHDMAINYCLVGHSEARMAFHETNEQLYKKLELLTKFGIIPIFCIGETLKEHEQKKTYEVLHQQVEPLLRATSLHNTPYFIAYEPVWAIGTGNVASAYYIQEVLAWIKDIFTNATAPITLFYGGTVNADTIESLKAIPLIDGFLIGKASTNFQELKKIVSLM